MRNALLCLCLCLAAAACGYNSSLRVTEHHESVGVDIFGNESMERDLEALLHDQLTRVLRDQSDAHLVDPRLAQAVIRGTILTYHRRSGIRNRENQLLETGIYIEIQAKLFVRGNETPVRSCTPNTWVGYTLDPAQPENESDARDRALRHLAEEVVLDLLGPGDDA